MTAEPILLLDTHVWLWLADAGPQRLKPSALRAIEAAGARGALRISVISVWEIAMLQNKGRLALTMDVREWTRRALDRADFELLGIDMDVAIESCRLPGTVHADPADRFLLATARLQKLTLVTRDERLLSYSRLGHVQALVA